MQNVSPKTGNEEAGRDGAEGNTIEHHVTVPGIVKVEQTSTSQGDLSGAEWNTGIRTRQTEYLSENAEAAS